MAVNPCWVNPVEVHNTNLNTNFIPNPLQSQPCVPPRHVGMTPIAPVCYNYHNVIQPLPKRYSVKLQHKIDLNVQFCFFQMDGLPINGMSALYHHHHHFHHYHYHHQTQSRNNLHPYALPVLHPRVSGILNYVGQHRLLLYNRIQWFRRGPQINKFKSSLQIQDCFTENINPSCVSDR